MPVSPIALIAGAVAAAAAVAALFAARTEKAKTEEEEEAVAAAAGCPPGTIQVGAECRPFKIRFRKGFRRKKTPFEENRARLFVCIRRLRRLPESAAFRRELTRQARMATNTRMLGALQRQCDKYDAGWRPVGTV